MRAMYLLAMMAALRSATIVLVTATVGPSNASPPPPAGICSCWASDTLTALGISVVLDPSCINNDQGCIGTSCRFCRIKDSVESLMYKPCSSVASTPTPTPTTLPPTPKPTPTSTSTPLPSTATKTSDTVDGCARWLSDGDKAAGIVVVGDTSCVNGGLGCVGLQCRFCREHDTPQSHHLLECSASSSSQTHAAPSPGPVSSGEGACTKWLSSDDHSVGVGIFGDATCAKGGVGCIANTTCRYCRAKDLPQSHHFVACPGASPTATSLPSSTTDQTCAKFSTSGDRAVGVLVASDTSCVNGGTGCIGSACRFCRSTNTSQSSHLLACTDLPSGSAVVHVETLNAETTSGAEPNAAAAGGSGLLVLAATVVAGVAAAIGALAFVVKSKSTLARWHSGGLAAPMCLEHRAASLADI